MIRIIFFLIIFFNFSLLKGEDITNSIEADKIEYLNLDGNLEEKKQENRYLGKFERPNLSGRKFEPTFIFTKLEQKENIYLQKPSKIKEN